MKEISGEISNLRKTGLEYNFGPYAEGYVLQTSKVDYQLSKQLYYNEHNLYKLGAGFCKPIINLTSGFIGVPTFKSKDIENQKILDEQLNNRSIFSNIPRNLLRDGDVYIYVDYQDKSDDILYNNDEFKINISLIAPEKVTKIFSTKNKDEVEKYIIQETVQYIDEDNRNIKYTIVETWTKDQHTIKYTNVLGNPDIAKNIVDEINVYGFIPIIFIKNENEDGEVNGRSELEPVEPYIRAYHDVMMDLLRSSKLTAKPKLKIKAEDIEVFLTNNFSPEEISSKNLNFINKDILILSETDEAGYIQVTANNHTDLLVFIFMCIVDVSETPEYAFGTAVSSSKASVGEQALPVLKKVIRKRNNLKDPYLMLSRMIYVLSNFRINSFQKIKDLSNTTIEWEELDKVDNNVLATTIKTLVEAFTTAIDSKLISAESAINFLSNVVPTMSHFEEENGEGEKEKILKWLEEFINKTTTDENIDENELDNMIKETLNNNNEDPIENARDENLDKED